jgi:hypothetical protein
MITPYFKRFIQPARAYPQVWRLLLGIMVMAVVYLLALAVLIGAIWLVVGTDNLTYWLMQMNQTNTPTGTLLVLASFIGMAAAPVVAARVMQKRGAATLFGNGPRVVRDFVTTASVVAILMTLSLVLWFSQYSAIPNLAPTTWVMFLPMALLGLLIQTGAEELVFRGYLQQQLGARFSSPLVWMVVPSVLFGLVHYDPTSTGGNAWIIVASATLFGLVAADLTARTGSLGAAWGFHFANNAFAVLFVALDGSITGLSLYLTPYSAGDTGSLPYLVLIDMVFLLLAWGLCRRALRR